MGKITKREKVNLDNIKKDILGMSGNLLIATNSEWMSDYIVIYSIPSSVIRSDDDLVYNLFGRTATNHAAKNDKQCINILNWYYKKYLLEYVINVNELEKIALEKNVNFGFAMEDFLVNTGDFKHGSQKQDKRKIDLISTKNGKLYQLKTSVVKPGNHGSAGTTNGRITK